MSIPLERTSIMLAPNQSRVLLRPFDFGDAYRREAIVKRILALSDEKVAVILEQVLADLSQRHKDVETMFARRFEQVCGALPEAAHLSRNRQLVIGSYFLGEYSLESAALFNPSIVPHPDQSKLPEGALRFILSLRATGEGHISSISFRTGVIHPNQQIEVFQPAGFLYEPTQVSHAAYDKALFLRKLTELGLAGEFTSRLMEKLTDPFTLANLRAALKAENALSTDRVAARDETMARGIWMAARSNYEVQFQPEQELSERVIFPSTPAQRNGIEDARFVCFHETGKTPTYFATFTAFDGNTIVPEILETSDFLFFRFITLNGSAARNKGMALFPRKIGGRYAMLGRQDNESISLMFSDHIHFWDEHIPLLKPAFPWELVQIGNCGSPMETSDGWLVLSHGVGPTRNYCIGAFLLDLNDPSKVIGRLEEPLLKPNQNEREGYVPNVVYTCGALIHNGTLIIPYGLADHATSFATVPLAAVLAAMK